MLKKRIKIDDSSSDETPNQKKTLQIKRGIENSQDKSQTPNSSQENSKEYPQEVERDFIGWIEKNLLKDLVANIKTYDFLKVYSQSEWGDELDNSKFIDNLLKAFFQQDDLELFKRNIQRLIETDEAILSLQKELESSNSKIKSLKSKNRKLLDTRVDKEVAVNLILADYDIDKRIKELLEEEISESNGGEFLIAFSSSLRELLVLLEYTKEVDESKRLDIIYKSSAKALKSISGLYSVNRKRLLGLLAEYLSSHFESYKFVSAEDYTYVDAKIHNIVVKEGQKVKESLTFCVIKKDSLQTIKYADVVTF